jgi:hypothetical protein
VIGTASITDAVAADLADVLARRPGAYSS